ncbi:peptide ABC transporter ATP-binding protein [Sutcliffiella cohnii]|uniref:Nickel import system ATP-binding protein NikD n=1 Tax=Sutcliffiella cohnii TaxID=33932 RepID=A0A223KMH3_9BACI|nr:ABC transporter ATP-binding protein [Sutcliffiella cohnii]AST90695.1 peptide ABC transporter ATP-binding protein [Sutcliffiella cohnii]
MSILEVENLSVSFTEYTKGFRREKRTYISSLDLSVKAGEVVAVVGASGSGKSLLAHAILGILPKNATVGGTIKYNGKLLTASRQKTIRGTEIALIPQSVNFLDPLMKVGKQVQTAVQNGDAKTKQRKVFERYQLKNEVEKMYPFQLSGGMARRVLLSTATVSGARLIIADEPTPGMDKAVLLEAMKSIRDLADTGCGVILITHDIDSALTIADKISVFYAGTNVETSPVQHFSGSGEKLRHPYSKALWRALPQNDFIGIEGTQPHASQLPPGCLFEPRCKMATDDCKKERPEMRSLRDGMVRCIYAT